MTPEARQAHEELHQAIAAEGPTPCQSSDPEMWFPESSWSGTSQAAALCRTVCPVRDQCLAYAILAEERYGIWGGMNAASRKNRRA